MKCMDVLLGVVGQLGTLKWAQCAHCFRIRCIDVLPLIWRPRMRNFLIELGTELRIEWHPNSPHDTIQSYSKLCIFLRSPIREDRLWIKLWLLPKRELVTIECNTIRSEWKPANVGRNWIEEDEEKKRAATLNHQLCIIIIGEDVLSVRAL